MWGSPLVQISWKAVRCVRPPRTCEKFVDSRTSDLQSDCSTHHEIQLFIYLPRTNGNALLAPLLRAHRFETFCLLNLLSPNENARAERRQQDPNLISRRIRGEAETMRTFLTVSAFTSGTQSKMPLIAQTACASSQRKHVI